MKKEKIGFEESFGMQISRSQGGKEVIKSSDIQLIGITRIFKNGKLLEEKRNAISNDLKAYVRDSFDSVTNQAIDNLMDDDEVGTGSTEDGTDGIAAKVGSTMYSMITTAQAASNTYGKKWQGQLTATGALAIDGAEIGFNYGATANNFGTAYATQSFSTVNLQSSDVLTIEWEIYVQ